MEQTWKDEALGAGDLSSGERGSGARFNAGKAPLHLIPAEVLALWAERQRDESFVENDLSDERFVEDVLDSLGMWQRREVPADFLLAHFDADHLREAAFVLDFGRKKYAEWNWAKGMDWSIPVGCIERHGLAVLEGEETDPDSGRTHIGHILCNVIMLVHYEKYYPEGDDRPGPECFGNEPERS